MIGQESLLKNWEEQLANLRKESKLLVQFLQEIVEKVDNFNDNINKELIQRIFPKLEEILRNEAVQYEENTINIMRNVVLKIIQKISNHTLPSDRIQKICNVILEVIERDNEENAILGVKIIQDVLLKNIHNTDIEIMEKIEKYLLLQFKDFEHKFHTNFGSTESSLLGREAALRTEEGGRRTKPKIASKDSFKVVAEIYLITVIAMGLYSKRPKPKIAEFVPHIVNALKLMPSREIQRAKKEKFIDFIVAQNKLYSIVSYLLRMQAASDALQKYSNDIAEASMTFLKNCPSEQSNVRKNFLGTLKFLIISYIDPYLKHFEDILNYQVLLGESERQDLRAQASMIILNVAQYTKDKLTGEQKNLIIHDLLRMINDITVTINFQSNAVVTLNKYIDIISKMSDCSAILMEIVQILTMKFRFLAKYLPKSYESRISLKEEEGKKKKKENNNFMKFLNLGDNDEMEVETPSGKQLEFFVDTGQGYLKLENDKEQDIGDLLKETKQIVQKMIALMQSVINTLCDFSSSAVPETENHLSEDKLEQLSKLFHYGIKYFVIKSSIYRAYGRNLSAEEEDLNKNVKLFMEIFVRLDISSFGQIFERQIGFLCKCITKQKTKKAVSQCGIEKEKGTLNGEKKTFDNEFLLKIPQFMKDELSHLPKEKLSEAKQSKSAVFAHILARYLLKKFKNIGGYKKLNSEKNSDTQKYTKTLCLFKIVMDIFSHLDDNENIHSYYLNFVVLSAKFSRKAKSFYHYFSVIKSVNKAINAKQPDPPKMFATLLPGLLTIILKVRQECPVLNELLTETCQFLPVNFRSLVEYLPNLARPFMDCISQIKVANNIASNAMRSFENWLAALTQLLELLDPLFKPILIEFITYLHKLFTCNHYTPSIHKILSRLGGKSRLYMIEKEAYTKSFPDEGLRMTMLERNTKKKIIAGMDVGLDASFRYLESTSKIKPENVKSIYRLVKAAYYAFMDESFDADYIRTCYSILVRHDYEELKKIVDINAAKNFDPLQPQMRITVMKRDSQKHALEKLLTEIFYMTAVYYTRKDSSKKLPEFFFFVCEHLVLIGLCRNGMLTRGNVDEIDPQTYLNVITEFLNESKDTVYPSQKKQSNYKSGHKSHKAYSPNVYEDSGL